MLTDLNHGRKVTLVKGEAGYVNSFFNITIQNNYPKAPKHFKAWKAYSTWQIYITLWNKIISLPQTRLYCLSLFLMVWKEIQQYLRAKCPLSYFLLYHLSPSRHLLQNYWRFFRIICCLLAFLTTNLLLSPMNCVNVLKLWVFLCRPYS